MTKETQLLVPGMFVTDWEEGGHLCYRKGYAELGIALRGKEI